LIPSRPASERAAAQIDRGLAAERLLGDAVVQAWFERRLADLTENMISAPITDDETRRTCAATIQLVRQLKHDLETEQTLGRKAAKDQERLKHGR
jgi:hypothetical protein